MKKTTHDIYFEVKNQYKNAIVLHCSGGFLRGYYNDALILHKELGYKMLALSLGDKQYCLATGLPLNVEKSVIRLLINKGYKVVVCKGVTDEVTLERSVEILGEYDKEGHKNLTSDWDDHYAKYYGMTEDKLCEEFGLVKMKRGNSKPRESLDETKVNVESQTITPDAMDKKEQLWLDFISLKKESLSMESSLFTLLDWKNKYSY